MSLFVICIFLMANDAEPLFMCLLTFHLSFVKCLFKCHRFLIVSLIMFEL